MSHLQAVREAVDRARASFKRWGGFAEAPRGAPGDGDAVDVPAGLALGLGGGVDHDAFAGAGRADQDGGAAWAGDRLDGLALLGSSTRASGQT